MPGPPNLNTREGLVQRRRTMVARLWARGLSQREIEEALAKVQDLRNPQGKPYSIATVNRDIQVIRLEMQQQYAADYFAHASEMLAQYREVRREAWRNGDLDAVLKACAAECKLMGLDRPDRLEVTWRREAEEAGFDAGDVFEKLVQQAEQLLAEGGGG